MKKPIILILNLFLVILFTSLSGCKAAPQTARQALLEMLFSKTPGSLKKHLPRATRAALPRAGTTPGTSLLSGLSTNRPDGRSRATIADVRGGANARADRGSPRSQ